MVALKIWERYFLREFGKIFCLFLFCFYFLYVLIDYASNAGSFHHHVQFQWKEIVLYYVCELAKRLEVLLPFALLLATIRTLCNFNIHNELIALMSGGFSLHTLMRPFLIIGIFCTGFIYLNTEYILPTALEELKHIHDSRSREKHKHQKRIGAQNLVLEDGTTLLFQTFDSSQKMFYDVYWIRSIDNIYRIKQLFPNTTSTAIPEGLYVEHLERNPQGELVRTESAEEKLFPEMHFNKATLFETITTAYEQSLSELWKKLPQQHHEMSEKAAQALAAFYFKLAMPWLCLFAIMAPIPSCVRSTRQLPVFAIYASSIFGLVAFYLVMDASLVLGERNTLPPSVAIWVPFGLFASAVTLRFFKKLHKV